MIALTKPRVEHNPAVDGLERLNVSDMLLYRLPQQPLTQKAYILNPNCHHDGAALELASCTPETAQSSSIYKPQLSSAAKNSTPADDNNHNRMHAHDIGKVPSDSDSNNAIKASSSIHADLLKSVGVIHSHGEYPMYVYLDM
jgi:hypothetical protein